MKFKEEYFKISLRERRETKDLKLAFAAATGSRPIVTIDENGFIVDGWTEAEVCEKLGLEPIVRQLSWDSQERKLLWIASKASRTPRVSPSQMHLSNFRCIKNCNGGTIQEKIASLASVVGGGESEKVQKRIIKRLLNSWDYGTLLSSKEIDALILEYADEGGSLTFSDLLALKKLSKHKQREALAIRVKKEYPWLACIESISEIQRKENVEIFDRLCKNFVRSAGPIIRWINRNRDIGLREGDWLDPESIGVLKSALDIVRKSTPRGACIDCGGDGCVECCNRGFYTGADNGKNRERGGSCDLDAKAAPPDGAG